MSEPKAKVELICSRTGHVTAVQPRVNAQGQQLHDPVTHKPLTETVVTGYFAQDAGAIVEMGEAEAQRHIERGLARAFTPERQRERAKEREAALGK